MKKCPVKSVWLVVLLSCWVASASAETDLAEVGGTAVGVVAPDGWCRLEPGKVADARVVGILEEGADRIGHSFVVAYADCRELERWRSARQRTLDNYGYVSYDKRYRKFVYPGTNAAFVSEIREITKNVGQEYVDDLVDRSIEVMKEVMPTAKLGKVAHLGMIGEDEASVYQGGIMPVQTELGDRKVLAISYATVLLRKKIMYSYLYTGYDDAQVFPRLLEEHKNWTARLRAVNSRAGAEPATATQ